MAGEMERVWEYFICFLLQCPSELKKPRLVPSSVGRCWILDLGDVFFPRSYFYSSVSHPARQRDVELQACPAATLNNMVLINPRGEKSVSHSNPDD